MSSAAASIGIGVFLAVLLLLLLNRLRDSSSGSAHCSALPAIADVQRFANRRSEILARILEPEDWEFVRKHSSPGVQRLFRAERKKIALRWLSEIRNQARAVMQFHVSYASRSEKILLRHELKLALEYAAIRSKCFLISIVLYLGGPLALRKISGGACRLSDQLKVLLELGLKPVPEAPGNSG